MDSVGNILAERRADRVPWGPATALALILHAAVVAGLLVSVFAEPMKYSKPRAVAVRLLRAGSIRAPEVRTAPAPPAPPAVAERPKIEKPVEEVPKPSEKAVLLPSKEDKKKPTPPPISRPGRPPVATPAVNLPSGEEESPGTTAGPAAGAGGSAGIGGFKIDQADFKYPIYIDRMVAIMSMNWFKPAQVVQTNPVVHFQIQRDGTITEVVLVTSSGLPFVDRAAMRAVYASSPLPPLPAEYAGPHLGIQVVFE
jgi:periplasmic protein TonB